MIHKCLISMINPTEKNCIACGNRCNSDEIAKFMPIYDENNPKPPVKHNKKGVSIVMKMQKADHKPKSAIKSSKLHPKRGASPYSSNFGAESHKSAISKIKRDYKMPPVTLNRKLPTETYKERDYLVFKAQITYAIQLLKQKKVDCAIKRLELLLEVV